MSGWKTEQTNMMPLHKRMKTDRTAMATLKLVVLHPISHFISYVHMEGSNTQLTPWKRRAEWLVICSSIDPLIRVAIPSMIGAFLPELGTVEIR